MKSHWCDQPFERKNKISATLKVSLWFNNRHTLGPYRGLNQSEIVKGGPPPPDIPVRVCASENACAAAVSQTEKEASSRDARIVANLGTLSLDFATFLPKKRLVTNPATSWTNFSESL